MISFIVIGKNEEKHLKLCLESIYKAIECCSIRDFELIYVDSNSVDDSIGIALSYSNISVFRIEKNESAATGRNIGGKHAKGDILFFIDGDMRLNPSFLKRILNENGSLKYDFVVGKSIYELYSSKWVFKKAVEYHKMITNNNEEVAQSSNGCFVIKADAWKSLGGLDERFVRASTEDVDFIFRARKRGIKLIRVNEVMIYHKVIDHNDPMRLWSEITSGRQFFGRSLLWRKNIGNIFIYKYAIRQEYSMLSLALCVLLAAVCSNMWLLCGYLGVLLIRSFVRGMMNSWRIHHFIAYFPIRDIGVILSFLFYYPLKKEVVYKKISKRGD